MEETPFAPFILSHMNRGRVLEIGCGRGAFTAHIDRDEIVALDVNRDFIVHCMGRPECARAAFVQADAHQLPFADRQFDCVVIVEVLMHLADPVVALREASRVLRPGGMVFATFLRKWTRNHLKVMAVVLSGVYRRRYGSFDYRFDTVRTIRRYAKKAGLSVTATEEVSWGNPCAIMVKSGGFRNRAPAGVQPTSQESETRGRHRTL